MAIIVLHNFLIDESTTNKILSMVDHETEVYRDLENGEWRNLLSGSEPLPSTQQIQNHARNWPVEAKMMRENLMNYFNSDIGSVAWQEKMV
ncbi:unnamed protein product [Meloidogyne enterolobii]|uniref:Uncharacterized protein n=1 Tax=Meloidogyne enterolobii TaxID=390850 RepID=A0ACB1A0L5_MELEN